MQLSCGIMRKNKPYSGCGVSVDIFAEIERVLLSESSATILRSIELTGGVDDWRVMRT